VTDRRMITRMPSGWSFAEAAAAPVVCLTAYYGLADLAGLRAGESVLIHAAAGGVGNLAGQIAKAAGAALITGVVGRREQAEYAMAFGYDRLVLCDDFPAGSGEDQFDVILDPVGGPARLASLERLAPHGRMAVYGNIATFAPITVSVNDLLMTGQSVLTYNSNLLGQTHPERLADSARTALRFVAAGEIRVDVTAEYELAELDRAIQRLADGQTHGKSIVRIG